MIGFRPRFSLLALCAVSWLVPQASVRAEAVVVIRQRVIVEVDSYGSSTGSLKLVETRNGVSRVLVGPVAARVGRNGVSDRHREGDGTTPIGTFALTSAFGTSSHLGVKLPYTRLAAGHCWISDSNDPAYNTLVRRQLCASPNEDLFRIGKAGAYRVAVVSSYNTKPIVLGKGSAIFVHVNSVDVAGRVRPTSGCVSVSFGVMRRLVSLLDPAARPTLTVRLKR